MGSILTAWGIHGTIGIAGLYCVLAAIIGRFLPIPGLFRFDTTIGAPERVGLGLFGALLAFPLVLASYREVGYGVHTVVTAPPEDEFVAVPTKPAGLGVMSEGCAVVEAFTLKEGDERVLKYALFDSQVRVTVESTEAASLRVKDKHYWLRVTKVGDYVDFQHAGRAYRLTCTAIYMAYAGPGALRLEACRW